MLHSGETETLSELVQGELTAALVVPLATAPGDPVAGASRGSAGLSGRVCGVAGAREADVLVVRSPGPTEWNCIRCAPMRPASR
ncbi:acyl-CoA dehydrogenase domain protein [Mycobacterium ulcerans str. Harvey]|uniref:Acyl-CoA dehydrogenase domain protein n=1 Tax=Mycobacterium ulcerans str. Harvey TaxID=1299332 RepID=A0ABN0R5C9_MYCUL|nr:acyl-CoA dehydrogenase domain protein [Mycobacterium ulcerans str. Harvey]